MSATTSSRRFWLLTCVAVVSMAVTASLGFWQLDRAQQKRDLEDRIATLGDMPALTGPELLDGSDPAAFLHRRVQFRGQWLPGTELFLDNRPMEGRTGFILLTAMRPEGHGQAVLVQRGWVPRDFLARDRLPPVVTPGGTVEIQGRLAPPPSQLFELGPGGDGPIRQNVDLSALAQEWKVPLLGGVSVLQTDADAAGLVRQWPRFVGGQHKHLAYATQWFAMCALVAGLYLWFQFLLPRLKRRSHGQNPR